jgi:hypothetical protein
MSLIRDRGWRVLDTFDYLAPAYQSKHTYTQVIGWFKKAGLSSIAKLEIPVSVKGKLEDPSLRSKE